MLANKYKILIFSNLYLIKKLRNLQIIIYKYLNYSIYF